MKSPDFELLVVSAEKLATQMALRLLQGEGLRVWQAHSLGEADEFLKDHLPEVILCDQRPRGGSGMAWGLDLASNRALWWTSFVLVSECPPQDRWRLYRDVTACGVSDVLFRPYDELQILQTVRAQLRLARLRRQTHATRMLVEEVVLPEMAACYPEDAPLSLGGHESRLRHVALQLQSLAFSLPRPSTPMEHSGGGVYPLDSLLARLTATLRERTKLSVEQSARLGGEEVWWEAQADAAFTAAVMLATHELLPSALRLTSHPARTDGVHHLACELHGIQRSQGTGLLPLTIPRDPASGVPFLVSEAEAAPAVVVGVKKVERRA